MKKQLFLLAAVCLSLTACENYTSNNPPSNQPGRGTNEPGQRNPGPAGQQPSGPGHQDVNRNPQGRQ